MVHIHHSQPLKIKFGTNHFLGSETFGPIQYREGVNDFEFHEFFTSCNIVTMHSLDVATHVERNTYIFTSAPCVNRFLFSRSHFYF